MQIEGGMRKELRVFRKISRILLRGDYWIGTKVNRLVSGKAPEWASRETFSASG